MMANQPFSWKQDIKAEAYRLGFALAGVTTIEPPAHLPVYQDWLKAGRHGKMAYLATDRARLLRANPGLVAPGSRSILIVCARYPAPGSITPPIDRKPFGRVASYAWGFDYHIVLKNRLEALAGIINRLAGKDVAHKAYTDTGPILEKELAQRAGLGWISKNTCLIAPKHGSYDLLAELFLDLDLEPDPPFRMDACGTCQRCIQACPTHCIRPDRTLDADRCISYLTIELKGSIPLDLRPAMGHWVFGCDICQMVCPWNIRFVDRQAGSTLSGLFPIREDIPFPDLVKELSLTPEAFNHKFKHSPVQRPRRRGYLRNVAIALGNSGDPTSLSALADVLSNEAEPLVRGSAAWALGRINNASARLHLSKALATETDPEVLMEVQSALDSYSGEGSVQ